MAMYIHVGAPKTATTFVQGFLDLNREKFRERGYRVVLPKGFRGSASYQYHAARHMGVVNGMTLGEARENFESFSRGPRPNTIISEEGLTHDLMPSERTKGGFGGIQEAVESLFQLTDGNANIVITIRRQDDFLDSCYKHRVKWQGCSLGYQEYFFTSVDIFALSWSSVIDAFEKRFPGRVRVVPFELIKEDERVFINEFCRACDVASLDGFSWDLPDQVKNESLSNAEGKALLDINRTLGRWSIGEGRRYKVITLVKELLHEARGENSFVDKLPQHWRARIVELYGKENAKLLDSYCPGLPSRLLSYYSGVGE